MKTKKFRGGYFFRRFAGQPAETLVELGLPERVVIPLAQGFGNSLPARVGVGDQVYAGQIIARDDHVVSSPIHATLNGRISSIEKRNYFNREVTMVTIAGSSSGDYKKLEGYSSQWDKLSVEKVEELIYLSGVSCLDRQGIPTRFKSSIIPPQEVEDLIIHGAASEAYNLSLATLLQGKNLYNFIEGVKILQKIMPQARIHLALGQKHGKIIEQIKKLTVSLINFNFYFVEPKYPQGYDEILIPALLGKKFPYGYSAANIGIIVLNIQAVAQVYEAVAQGRPLLERTIALCGPGFKRPQHLKVRVGTALADILKDRLTDALSRVVLDSLLAGVRLNDFSLPVNRTFSQIIALPEGTQRELLVFLKPGWRQDSYSNTFAAKILKTKKKINTNCHGEERPCIQCGYCREVCPVDIIPTLIDRQARKNISEILMRIGIFNCIDCNLCSYVCPSKIPLAARIKEAKAKLIETGCDHSLCTLPKFDLIGLEEYKGVKVTR